MKPSTPTISRSVNVDVVRIAAMLMIVGLHTILNFTVRVDFFATKLWFFFEPFMAVSKIGVLLFCMLSGYLVIGKKRSIRDNWWHSLKRIGIPLAFFIVLGYFLDPHEFPRDIPTRLINFPGSSLWFLVVLLPMYLLNPLWQVVFSLQQKLALALFITKAAFLFTLSATLIQYLHEYREGFYTTFTAWLGFLFFYLYGGLVANSWVRYTNTRLNWGLFGAGFVMTMAYDYVTQWFRIQDKYLFLSGYTENYLSLPLTMMAIGLFNVLIAADLSSLKTRILPWLASLSFGIYLVHTYIVRVLTLNLKFSFDMLSMNVYAYNILNYCLVLGISIVIVSVVKKIPILRNAIGG